MPKKNPENDLRYGKIQFEELKLSVMAIMYYLTQDMNISQVFSLLPVLPEGTPPENYLPGDIISARFGPWTRGRRKKKAGKGFLRNAIILDIMTLTKEVSVKVFKNKFHMCGIKSKDLSDEAANYLTAILNSIQDDLNYLRSQPDEFRVVSEWLTVSSKGEAFVSKGGYSFQQIKHMAIIPTSVPEIVDRRIANFILSHIGESQIYDQILDHLESLRDFQILPDPKKAIAFSETDVTMINYNYDLGVTIHRMDFVDAINDLKAKSSIEGIESVTLDYKNTGNHFIKLFMPYEKTLKNKKTKEHIFLIYKNGLVTQSGPSTELMKLAYDKFLLIFSAIRDRVKISDRQELVDRRKPTIIHYMPVI